MYHQKALGLEAWQHLVGVFDGKTVTIYVNGESSGSKECKQPTIAASDKFWIAGTGHKGFKGMIDDVRIYSYALSPQDAKNRYVSSKTGKLSTGKALEDAVMLRGEGFEVNVGKHGGMMVEAGAAKVSYASAFSCPGKAIGWNHLGGGVAQEGAWRITRAQQGPACVVVDGQGRDYRLQRRIQIRGHRVHVADKLTNVSGQNVGVIIRHKMIASQPFTKCLLGGVPENRVSKSPANPTVYAQINNSAVGFLAEDNISRAYFEADSGINEATVSCKHLAIAPGKSHSLEWSLYPIPADADYFGFINRVRRDWDVNHTVEGSFEYHTFYYGNLPTVEHLKALFARKPVKLVVFTPFLEYPAYGLRITREVFKQKFIERMNRYKKAQPGVKCLASIEGALVGYDAKALKSPEMLDAYINNYKGPIYGPVSAEVSRMIEASDLPWQGSYIRSPEGHVGMQIYRPPNPKRPTATALMVYPYMGSSQHKYLMDQVRFLIEEVCSDGVYFDTFNWITPDYSRWDGVSADLDPRTGQIKRTYTNCALAVEPVQAELFKYILDRGGYVVRNAPSAGRETRSLPAFRLMETQVTSLVPGEKPPLSKRIASGHLSTPLAMMGMWGEPEKIYRGVITYLRHGMLCYFYNTRIPKEKGDFGPFRHMFPFTPVALHEGWVEGKERIITCVSGAYLWKDEAKPAVYCFDRVGRATEHTTAIKKTPQGWTIKMKLKDWEEIAVIEKVTR